MTGEKLPVASVGDAENAIQENAGLENVGTTLYGTPCIPYVCSVLQDATIEYV